MRKNASQRQLDFAANLGVTVGTNDPDVIARGIGRAIQDRVHEDRHERFAKLRTELVRATGVRDGSIIRLSRCGRTAVVVEIVCKGDGMPRAVTVFVGQGTPSGAATRNLVESKNGVDVVTFACIATSPQGHVHIRVACLQIPAHKRAMLASMIRRDATLVTNEYGDFVSREDLRTALDRLDVDNAVWRQPKPSKKAVKPSRKPPTRAGTTRATNKPAVQFTYVPVPSQQKLIEKVERDRLRRLEKLEEEAKRDKLRRKQKREARLSRHT